MSIDPRTPVIIGVGQAIQRSKSVDESKEPAVLMADAARAAIEDSGSARTREAIEAIRVVNTISVKYRDPGALIAEHLGAHPRETATTPGGGNTPQSLVNLAALEIQRREFDCVLLCGGETWRTRQQLQKQGRRLEGTVQPDDVHPTRHIGTDIMMANEVEMGLGIVRPVQIYPMFESAIRADLGRTPAEHLVKVSEVWARFSAIAADNPYAWVRDAKSAEEIRTASPSNRMIGLPYPKYMNSNNDVDQTAALIICSVERAESLGVPKDRWIFPIAGTDAHDHYFVSNRADLRSSPAIRLAGQRAMALAGKGVDDFATVDLYSCFPSAVQIAARELGFGFSLNRDLTVTGGLPFAGGPWNNYVMHSICTTVLRLRERPGEYGFVSANGGYVTKHAFGVYSTNPPAKGFLHDDPQAEVDAMPRREVAQIGDYVGRADIEGYTVMHDREGHPETAYIAALLPDGRRAWGVNKDPDVAAAMCEGEWVGTHVSFDAGNGFEPS